MPNNDWKSNPNEIFIAVKFWLVRGLQFLIFLVGLVTIGSDVVRPTIGL